MVEIMEIKASQFKPKVKGKADFFSWQLYKWLLKNPHYTQVWAATWCSIHGVIDKPETLYIGSMEEGKIWFHGNRLSQVCGSGNKLESFAYCSGFDLKNWVDVTDKFWSDYSKIGVCAIHGDLMHEWNVENYIRTCQHCGKKEKMRIVQSLQTKELWEQSA